MQKQAFLLGDIGNSSVCFSQYDGQDLTHKSRFQTDLIKFEDIQSLGSNYQKVIISSVVPEVDYLFESFSNVVFVHAGNIPLLTINMDAPNQVGADRLVNALGAYGQFKKQCLIIDSGTALTFCYVDKEGCYQGGGIFPGMGISSKALHLYTSKIPHIEVKSVKALYGKSTKEAVQTGLYHGYQDLINGMIGRYKADISGLHVVGTGQGLDVLLNNLHLDDYDPNLVFKGLQRCVGLSV